MEARAFWGRSWGDWFRGTFLSLRGKATGPTTSPGSAAYQRLPMLRFLNAGSAFVRLTATAVAIGALSSVAPSVSHAAAPGSVQNDSLEMRETLSREILKFQEEWRELWLSSIIAHGGGWVNESQAQYDEVWGYYTPTVLRLHALNCYLDDSPIRQIFGRRSSRFAGSGGAPLILSSPMRISGASNRSSVCPQWYPKELGETPDEGVRLDRALTPNARRDAIARRQALLERLEDAAETYPTDGWITGQRVRFLLDNGEMIKALAVARSCGGIESWCASLEGLVLAQMGELVAAEAAFLRGVRSLTRPSNGACADTSARPLFPEEVRKSLRNGSCDEWSAIEQRLWWLSKPLWHSEANERLVEHHVRRTLLTLRTVVDEDERYIWRKSAAGDALEEVIMRYGWPTHTWWGGYFVDGKMSDYSIGRRNQAEYPYTVKEYSADRVAVVPDFKAVEQPYSALDSHWQFERPSDRVLERWFPTEHMKLGTPLSRLPAGQSVMLRRDSNIVYGQAVDDAVHDLDPDEHRELRAYLFSGASPGNERLVTDTALTLGRSLRVTAQLPATPTVLSLEVPSRNAYEPAHRLRFGVQPPSSLSQMGANEVSMSQPAFILLPAFGAPAITNPDSAIARLAGSTDLPRNVPLALYWESYGFAAGDTIDVQLQILRRDGSALRSIGAFFGIADARRDSVSIGWREPDNARNAEVIPALIPAVARAVSVDVRTLEAGTYVFRVEMRRKDGAIARGERQVEILP